MGATLIFQFTNLLNHVRMCDPGLGSCAALDISAPQDFGVLGNQINTPRQMEFGIRIHF